MWLKSYCKKTTDISSSLFVIMCFCFQIQDTAHSKGVRTTLTITPGITASIGIVIERATVQFQGSVEWWTLHLCAWPYVIRVAGAILGARAVLCIKVSIALQGAVTGIPVAELSVQRLGFANVIANFAHIMFPGYSIICRAMSLQCLNSTGSCMMVAEACLYLVCACIYKFICLYMPTNLFEIRIFQIQDTAHRKGIGRNNQVWSAKCTVIQVTIVIVWAFVATWPYVIRVAPVCVTCTWCGARAAVYRVAPQGAVAGIPVTELVCRITIADEYWQPWESFLHSILFC